MGYGIPYMGSKQAIVASIVSSLPKAENFYDLFGGGFSISHYVLQERKDKYKHVHYNEIKADVVDLVLSMASIKFSSSHGLVVKNSSKELMRHTSGRYGVLETQGEHIFSVKTLSHTRNRCTWQLCSVSSILWLRRFLGSIDGQKRLIA
jgi:hypothetical protein